MKNTAFRFVGFGDAAHAQPHIMVDSGRLDTTILELSHWPGNQTPAAYKADTSTGIVLNALPHLHDHLPSDTSTVGVGVDHYDVDGILSAWALLNPGTALDAREDLIAIATTGDFDRYTTDAALRSCLAINGLEDACVLAAQSLPASSAAFSNFIYNGLLPQIAAAVGADASLAPAQAKEYAFVQDSLARLQSGAGVQKTVYGDIDLTVFMSDKPLHPIAVNTVADTGHIALYVAERNSYVVSQRYESFVDLPGRTFAPRANLLQLKDILVVEEQSQNALWYAEPEFYAHACLTAFARDRASTRVDSSLSADVLVARTKDFLTQFFAAHVAGARTVFDATRVDLPPSYAGSSA